MRGSNIKYLRIPDEVQNTVKPLLPYVAGSLSVIDFHLSYMKVIDMVKDEMVKQGKGRGTGRPGKIVLNNPLFVLGVIVSSNLLSS